LARALPQERQRKKTPAPSGPDNQKNLPWRIRKTTLQKPNQSPTKSSAPVSSLLPSIYAAFRLKPLRAIFLAFQLALTKYDSFFSAPSQFLKFFSFGGFGVHSRFLVWFFWQVWLVWPGLASLAGLLFSSLAGSDASCFFAFLDMLGLLG
jgi:hypothetical protein